MGVNPRDGSYRVPGNDRHEDFADMPTKAPARNKGEPSYDADANPPTDGEKNLWRDDFASVPWKDKDD